MSYSDDQLTTHDYARHSSEVSNEDQRPEGALIQGALERKRMSARRAALAAGMSDARWRQIVNGYQSVGAGQTATVIGPPDTIARMARVVGVSADDLRTAGRADAAEAMDAETVGTDTEGDPSDLRYRKPEGWTDERWRRHRAQLDAIHNALLDQADSER